MLFGRALLLTQNVELAETVLRQATERRPIDPLAFYYLADAAERRGHPAVAAARCSTIARSKETNPDSRRRAALAMRLAICHCRAATRRRRQVVSARPRGWRADLPLLVKIAEAQFRSGALDAALATIHKALDKDPANRDALALLGRFKIPAQSRGR